MEKKLSSHIPEGFDKVIGYALKNKGRIQTAAKRLEVKDPGYYTYEFKLRIPEDMPKYTISKIVSDMDSKLMAARDWHAEVIAAGRIDPALRLHRKDIHWALFAMIEEAVVIEMKNELAGILAIRKKDNELYQRWYTTSCMRLGMLEKMNLEMLDKIIRTFGKHTANTLNDVVTAVLETISNIGTVESLHHVFSKIRSNLPNEEDIDLGCMKEIQNIMKNGFDKRGGEYVIDKHLYKYLNHLADKALGESQK